MLSHGMRRILRARQVQVLGEAAAWWDDSLEVIIMVAVMTNFG